MKFKHLLFTSTGLLASASLAVAAVESDDFEGNTPATPVGNQTFNETDTTQQGLFTAESGTGHGGGMGVVVDAAAVKSNYRHKLASQAGVAGNAYRASTRFQMTIDDTAPAQVNHAVLGVMLSNQPEWWNGNNFGLSLLRRGGGTTFGINGIGQNTANPEAWRAVGGEPNSDIGLPDTLPGAGTTATSEWFTLQLTIVDTGTVDANVPPRPLWDVTADVINDSGTVVFTHTVEDRVITTNVNNPNDPAATAMFAPGDTIYAGVLVPWVSSNDYLALDEGHVDGLVFDDLVLAGGSSAIDADSDGLSDAEELLLGTDDTNPDSDGDTFTDGDEVNVYSTDPLDPNDYNGAPVKAEDDFNSRALGTPPDSDWSTKWDGNNPSQRLRWAVAAGNGTDGSQGYGLDVTKAWRNYRSINRSAVTGDKLVLSADFQFSTTGAPLDESGTGGINGTNDGLFGLRLDETEFFYNGAAFDFTVCRRADNNWGVLENGVLQGWLNNTDIGLAAGLTPDTSDWFTMSIEVDETTPGSGVFEAVCKVTYQGTELYSSPAPIALNVAIDPLSGVYGGLTTGWNNDPSNTGAPPVDPADTAPAMPVGPIGKISDVNVDNFLLIGYDSTVDVDMDGLNQVEENQYGTSDLLADTDGDTFSDDTEINSDGTDPLDPNDYLDAPVRTADDFNSRALGTPPTSDWSTKWEGNNPSQQMLWAVEAANGVGGGQGFALDESKAWLNYHTVNKTPVLGEVVTIEGDFQFSTTGAPLDESGTGGINGVNDRLLGLLVSTVPEWWNVNGNTGFTFALCRRADDNFGFQVGNSLEGWFSNSDIGLAPGLTPDNSGWFTLSVELSETAPGSGAYQAVCRASYDGTVFFTSAPAALPVAFVPGSDVYGGFTNAWNADPSNATAPPIDPLDTSPNTPVGQIGKLNGIDADNFLLVGYSGLIDTDMDNLSQAQEALLGTSDLHADTDGDGFNDDVEVTAGTDPLDPLDYPGAVTTPLLVRSISFTDADTIEVQFTGKDSTVYKLTSSPDLVMPFKDTGATGSTNAMGVGSISYDLPLPMATEDFFRVEEQ